MNLNERIKFKLNNIINIEHTKVIFYINKIFSNKKFIYVLLRDKSKFCYVCILCQASY